MDARTGDKLRPNVVGLVVGSGDVFQLIVTFLTNVKMDMQTARPIRRPTVVPAILAQIGNVLQTLITVKDGRDELDAVDGTIAFRAKDRFTGKLLIVVTACRFDLDAILALRADLIVGCDTDGAGCHFPEVQPRIALVADIPATVRSTVFVADNVPAIGTTPVTTSTERTETVVVQHSLTMTGSTNPTWHVFPFVKVACVCFP